MFNKLLAKTLGGKMMGRIGRHTAPNEESTWLVSHLYEVHRAAKEMIRLTLGDQLRAMALPRSPWQSRYSRVLSVSAIVHDWGKATDYWQRFIRNTDQFVVQPIRHEWITWWLLHNTELGPWLRQAVSGKMEWLGVLSAVAGHHPSMSHDSPPLDVATTSDGVPADSRIVILTGHPDFAEMLQKLAVTLKLPPPPKMSDIKADVRDIILDIGKWMSATDAMIESMAKKEYRRNDLKANTLEKWKRLIAAVKPTLLCSDVIGSVRPFEVPEDQVDALVDNMFRLSKLVGNEYAHLIDKRLKEMALIRGVEKCELRDFQKRLANAKADAILFIAGSGNGKTFTAYNWMATSHPTLRLFYCYPTTGTTTEGYRDYQYDNETDDIRVRTDMFHSRVLSDKKWLLDDKRWADADDSSDEKDSNALMDYFWRINSLAALDVPIAACTVDSALGVMGNLRRMLYAWPAMVQAAFVFDELHLYDDGLFSALLTFLSRVPGLPVLMMTASLQKDRLRALKKVMKESGRKLTVIRKTPELREMERWPRYRIANKDDYDNRWRVIDAVKAEVAAGGKVLWVCNTVDRCRDAYDEWVGMGYQPLQYHSRYRYIDRIDRHNDVINAFKLHAGKGGSLAFTTQVAEVSLDLDATTLVTEKAPIAAMIQRLGRLNRSASATSGTRPVYILNVSDSKPYTLEQMEKVDRWLARLPSGRLCCNGENISQADLAREWGVVSRREQAARFDLRRPWLDGVCRTEVKNVREAGGTLPVIMEFDVPKLTGDNGNRLYISDVMLPMLLTSAVLKKYEKWPRFRRCQVIAPTGTIKYSPLTGGEWII